MKSLVRLKVWVAVYLAFVLTARTIAFADTFQAVTEAHPSDVSDIIREAGNEIRATKNSHPVEAAKMESAYQDALVASGATPDQAFRIIEKMKSGEDYTQDLNAIRGLDRAKAEAALLLAAKNAALSECTQQLVDNGIPRDIAGTQCDKIVTLAIEHRTNWKDQVSKSRLEQAVEVAKGKIDTSGASRINRAVVAESMNGGSLDCLKTPSSDNQDLLNLWTLYCFGAAVGPDSSKDFVTELYYGNDSVTGVFDAVTGGRLRLKNKNNSTVAENAIVNSSAFFTSAGVGALLNRFNVTTKDPVLGKLLSEQLTKEFKTMIAQKLSDASASGITISPESSFKFLSVKGPDWKQSCTLDGSSTFDNTPVGTAMSGTATAIVADGSNINDATNYFLTLDANVDVDAQQRINQMLNSKLYCAKDSNGAPTASCKPDSAKVAISVKQALRQATHNVHSAALITGVADVLTLGLFNSMLTGQKRIDINSSGVRVKSLVSDTMDISLTNDMLNLKFSDPHAAIEFSGEVKASHCQDELKLKLPSCSFHPWKLSCSWRTVGTGIFWNADCKESSHLKTIFADKVKLMIQGISVEASGKVNVVKGSNNQYRYTISLVPSSFKIDFNKMRGIKFESEYNDPNFIFKALANPTLMGEALVRVALKAFMDVASVISSFPPIGRIIKDQILSAVPDIEAVAATFLNKTMPLSTPLEKTMSSQGIQISTGINNATIMNGAFIADSETSIRLDPALLPVTLKSSARNCADYIGFTYDPASYNNPYRSAKKDGGLVAPVEFDAGTAIDAQIIQSLIYQLSKTGAFCLNISIPTNVPANMPTSIPASVPSSISANVPANVSGSTPSLQSDQTVSKGWPVASSIIMLPYDSVGADGAIVSDDAQTDRIYSVPLLAAVEYVWPLDKNRREVRYYRLSYKIQVTLVPGTDGANQLGTRIQLMKPVLSAENAQLEAAIRAFIDNNDPDKIAYSQFIIADGTVSQTLVLDMDCLNTLGGSSCVSVGGFKAHSRYSDCMANASVTDKTVCKSESTAVIPVISGKQLGLQVGADYTTSIGMRSNLVYATDTIERYYLMSVQDPDAATTASMTGNCSVGLSGGQRSLFSLGCVSMNCSDATAEYCNCRQCDSASLTNALSKIIKLSQ